MEMTHSIGYSSHRASTLSRGGDLQLLMRIGEKSDKEFVTLFTIPTVFHMVAASIS